MNTIREQSEPEAVRGAGDYFLVSGQNQSWCVSTAMARHIESLLDASPPARWVSFVDLSGSRVRVRSAQIECIAQCTAQQRAQDRAFSRKLKQEFKEDRSWDEES